MLCVVEAELATRIVSTKNCGEYTNPRDLLVHFSMLYLQSWAVVYKAFMNWNQIVCYLYILLQYLVSKCCQGEYGAGACDLITLIVGLAVEVRVCDNIGIVYKISQQTNVYH